MAISRVVPPVPPAHVPFGVVVSGAADIPIGGAFISTNEGGKVVMMTQAWVEYYAKLDAFLREVRAAIP